MWVGWQEPLLYLSFLFSNTYPQKESSGLGGRLCFTVVIRGCKEHILDLCAVLSTFNGLLLIHDAVLSWKIHACHSVGCRLVWNISLILQLLQKKHERTAGMLTVGWTLLQHVICFALRVFLYFYCFWWSGEHFQEIFCNSNCKPAPCPFLSLRVSPSCDHGYVFQVRLITSCQNWTSELESKSVYSNEFNMSLKFWNKL